MLERMKTREFYAARFCLHFFKMKKFSDLFYRICSLDHWIIGSQVFEKRLFFKSCNVFWFKSLFTKARVIRSDFFRVKKRLKAILKRDRAFTAEDYETLNPNGSLSIKLAMDEIQNPVKACEEMNENIHDLNLMIRERARNRDSERKCSLCMTSSFNFGVHRV